MFFNRQFIDNWVDREIKSIVKMVTLSFVPNYYCFFPRSGRNTSVEPIAEIIVERILNYNEKIFFLSLKYILNCSIPYISQLLIYYSWFKAIKLIFNNY